MTDYTELQRLAEHHLSLGHAYTVATPAAVLALIAENARLHKLVSWQGDANNEVTISAGQLMKHMDERDQLKAENEALRKDDLRAGLMALAAYIGPICTAAVVAAMGKGE